MTCPNCGKCPYLEGQCVERIAKGRRYFLMGALALPLAHKIERLAPIITPKLVASGGPETAAFGSAMILMWREVDGDAVWEIKYGPVGEPDSGKWSVHKFDVGHRHEPR